MRRSRWLLPLLVSGVAFFAACGGAVEAVPVPDGGPAPAVVSSSEPVTCDAAEIAEGRHCAARDEKRECEIGSDARSECNAFLTCREGVWAHARGPLANRCPTPPVPHRVEPGCPPIRPRVGTTCSTTKGHLWCNYGLCTGFGDDSAGVMTCEDGIWTPGCWD